MPTCEVFSFERANRAAGHRAADEKVCVPKIGFRKRGVSTCEVFSFERPNRAAGHRAGAEKVCVAKMGLGENSLLNDFCMNFKSLRGITLGKNQEREMQTPKKFV